MSSLPTCKMQGAAVVMGTLVMVTLCLPSFTDALPGLPMDNMIAIEYLTFTNERDGPIYIQCHSNVGTVKTRSRLEYDHQHTFHWNKFHHIYWDCILKTLPHADEIPEEHVTKFIHIRAYGNPDFGEQAGDRPNCESCVWRTTNTGIYVLVDVFCAEDDAYIEDWKYMDRWRA